MPAEHHHSCVDRNVGRHRILEPVATPVCSVCRQLDQPLCQPPLMWSNVSLHREVTFLAKRWRSIGLSVQYKSRHILGRSCHRVTSQLGNRRDAHKAYVLSLHVEITSTMQHNTSRALRSNALHKCPANWKTQKLSRKLLGYFQWTLIRSAGREEKESSLHSSNCKTSCTFSR